MALYAAFLVTVGIPLMAIGADVSRVYLMQVRLRNATEAACEAYANNLDVKTFCDTGIWHFNDQAASDAYRVFFQSIPTGGSISYNATEKIPSDSGHIFVVECRGQLIVSPILWVGISYYNLTQIVQVKVKFANSHNWVMQQSE
jgi:hypothetical protein